MRDESPIREWLDNPIFVKHVRSRLRPGAAISWIAIVLTLCAGVTAVGIEYGWYRSGFTIISLLTFQSILLGVMGASQIASIVGNVRTSGILEFHRVSPLTAAELVFGFLLGAPIREYMLFAVTLPFVGFCAWMSVPTPRGAVQLVILVVASSWVLHGLALLTSLMSRRATAARGASALIVLLCVLCAPGVLSLMQLVRSLDVAARLPFFGYRLPWLFVVLIAEASVLLFVMLACLRKIRSDQIHALSKPQAIACLLTLGILALGGMWNQGEAKLTCVVLTYALALLSIVLLSSVTPDRTEYTRSLLRARRVGRDHARWWDDLAWNRGVLLIFCGIVFVIPMLCWKFSLSTFEIPGERFRTIQLAIANGVLLVAYYGLGLQYFLLRFPGRGMNFAGAFFILAWGIPLLVGATLASGSLEQAEIARIILALSPIAGVGLSATPVPAPDADAVAFASICPTLLYTFVFGTLSVTARRHIDREVRLNFDNDPEFHSAADKVLKKLGAEQTLST